MKVIKIIFGIIAAIFLIVGIPIIINECYKANCGYITVWDGADVLGYYGAILGSIIAVATFNKITHASGLFKQSWAASYYAMQRK